jgi:glycosyltransferase involved in cell wall biosynthesis
MRILVVIPALGAIYGGPSKIATELAAALGRRASLTVDLVTTNANGPDNLTVPCSIWQETNVGYRLKYFQRLGRSEYKLSPALFVWLWRQVKEYDAVLVISIFNFPVLACALACRVKQVPYSVNPQGMLEPWALGYKVWKKQAYYRIIERPLVLRRARAIQALNECEAENIRKLKLGPPVVTLPNGVDRSELEPAAESDREAFLSRFSQTRDKTRILFLHRIDPKKGLDLLARSLSAIRARHPMAHLVIAGPDNIGFTDKARSYFTAAGLGDDTVTFTGMLEGAARRGALASAEVFVLPSYSEGFSMAVLEAMAAGLPCVITTGCNFPEAGEAGVARVVPAEAEACAKALEDLLANPKEAMEMGRRAREFVRAHYTWDAIAERMEEILKTAVANRKVG